MRTNIGYLKKLHYVKTNSYSFSDQQEDWNLQLHPIRRKTLFAWIQYILQEAILTVDSQIKSSELQDVGVTDLTDDTLPRPLVIVIDHTAIDRWVPPPLKIPEDFKRIVSYGRKVSNASHILSRCS